MGCSIGAHNYTEMSSAACFASCPPPAHTSWCISHGCPLLYLPDSCSRPWQGAAPRAGCAGRDRQLPAPPPCCSCTKQSSTHSTCRQALGTQLHGQILPGVTEPQPVHAGWEPGAAAPSPSRAGAEPPAPPASPALTPHLADLARTAVSSLDTGNSPRSASCLEPRSMGCIPQVLGDGHCDPSSASLIPAQDLCDPSSALSLFCTHVAPSHLEQSTLPAR